MEYRQICGSLPDMNDEELFTLEKKASEERRRRIAEGLSLQKTPARILVDLAPLINSVREAIREEMCVASDPIFALLLDQIEGQPVITEEQLIFFYQVILTIAYAFEARCEMERRLEMVR